MPVKTVPLLAATTVIEAMRVMHEYLSHEVQVLELRQQIASQAAGEMSRQQREYALRQHLQAIKKELGEENPEEAEAAELRRRLEEAELPEPIHKDVEKELNRLQRMSPAAPDFQIARTYVDFILELPWKKNTDDVLDLGRAREVLDRDHFFVARALLDMLVRLLDMLLRQFDQLAFFRPSFIFSVPRRRRSANPDRAHV